MLRSALAGVFVLAFITLAQAQEKPAEVPGRIEAVTVYRGQALVTRVVEVPGGAGLREVIVTGLPAAVVPGSIYAEADAGVQVRSVSYRERPVAQDVREGVRQLENEIKAVQDKIAETQRQLQLLAEQKTYLDKLENFTAPTANVEMTKGVLDAAQLQKLTAFQFEQRKAVATQELAIGRQQRDLNEQLSLLQRRLQELTNASSRTAREAVVFANLQGANGRLRLRYLVNSATWSPSYNARTDAERKNVTLEYYASIQQMSGEDWNDVDIALSTATPSLVAKAPTLDPLVITLAAAPAGQTEAYADDAAVSGLMSKLEQERIVVENRYNTFNLNMGGAINEPSDSRRGRDAQQVEAKNLNALAEQRQVLELVAKKADRRPSDEFAAVSEGVSVTYQLPNKTNLPSRSDQQLIQITSAPMKAEFHKVAIPVLTSFVYDEATVTNESKNVLLAGPVSTYLAGQFVGHGEIPTVAVGETFRVGFGIDSSLRATRELTEKTDTTQGGNRVSTFTYRIAVENFSDQAVAVRVLDRLPMGKDGHVKLTLAPAAQGMEISADPAYLATDRKKGILRWDVEVPAQAIGPKALAIEYQFSLEYDRQMSVSDQALRR